MHVLVVNSLLNIEGVPARRPRTLAKDGAISLRKGYYRASGFKKGDAIGRDSIWTLYFD